MLQGHLHARPPDVAQHSRRRHRRELHSSLFRSIFHVYHLSLPLFPLSSSLSLPPLRLLSLSISFHLSPLTWHIRYAGVQNGGQCWCGNTYGSFGLSSSPSECRTPCNANLCETCGGGYPLIPLSSSPFLHFFISLFLSFCILSLMTCRFRNNIYSTNWFISIKFIFVWILINIFVAYYC